MVDPALALPPLGGRVVRATMLGTNERVDVTETGSAVVLALPPASGDEPDRVVVVVTAGKP